MALIPGTRLGSYEITAQIGVGGMGEVYRATDTNLKRQVAIKVLPASVAGDAERLARFRREAEVLAALNHPNIAAIHGLEKTPEFTALVMELVEGDDLSQRIARGAIPMDEALPIAKQIALALEAAHEQGIIHRDLKPANIKVRADGTVKVLDFGLAKAMEPAAGSSPSASMSPTITSPAMMTGIGMILGTAAYMSPEQARGKVVDKRADIWAFGVVLYEMLTGRRAFEDEDVSMTLSQVLQRDPDFDAIPASIPPRVTQAIRLCLRKDPKQRAADIRDVRLALDGAFETTTMPAVAAVAPAASRTARLAWATAAAAVLVAAALAVPAVRYLRQTPSSGTHVAHLTMSLEPAERLGPAPFYGRPSRTAFAISPDGAAIVFAAGVGESRDTGDGLFRRALADAQAVAIPGTEGAEYPFFSPDGQWVGFSAGNKLKKVALAGGPPIDICDLPIDGRRVDGASWGTSGVIVFARGGVWTVSSAGGKPEELIKASAKRDLSPAVLPDGRTVLFTENRSGLGDDKFEVDAVDMTTKQRKALLTDAADAHYVPTGHLVFMKNATLLAVPFDAARVETTGAPVPLVAGVMQAANAPNGNDEVGMGQFAVSASGTLVYAAGGRFPTASSTLVRIDRKGVETKLADIKGAVYGLRVSASGSRAIAFETGNGSRASDVWMFELPSGAATRLTSTGDAGYPLFMPGGQSVMFSALGGGAFMLPLGGGAPVRVLDEARPYAASLSPDGKWLAGLTRDAVNQIFVAPIRDGKPDASAARQFSPSTFAQRDATFSPDGRWIAYSSNESGAFDTYVQPFPGQGEKHRVSSGGCNNPAWSVSGKEIFCLVRPATTSSRGTIEMMAIDVSTTGDFKAGVQHKLFEGEFAGTTPLRSFDVTPDGAFIMNRTHRPPNEPVTTLHVVLGWAEELKTKVVAGK